MLFLIAYDLFHKKDTFFSLNRLYLLATSALSFVLPFIRVKSIPETIPAEYVVKLPVIVIGQSPIQEAAPISSTTTEVSQVISHSSNYFSFESINWWILVYGIVVAFMLFRFVQRVFRLKALCKKAFYHKIEGYKVFTIPNNKDAFSFFNAVYLGDQLTPKEKEQIIIHEIVHLRQKHTLDLLWFEFLKIIFWFNPLIYVYQSRIDTLHEYIADSKSVDVLGKRKYYEQLLHTTFETEDIDFINQFFNQSLLKKRITMLQKSQSKTIAKFKYLLLIPILGTMLIVSSFANKSEDDTNTLFSENDRSQISDIAIKDTLDLDDKKIVDQLIEIKTNVENGASFKEFADLHNNRSMRDIIYISKDEKFTDAQLLKVVLSLKEGEISQPFRTMNGWNIVLIESIVADVRMVRQIRINLPELTPYNISGIDKVPSTEACKGLLENYKIKKCVSNEISDFVASNFDHDIFKTYPHMSELEGQIRFKIDTLGKIVDLKFNLPIPEPYLEAKRIFKLLPRMIPGEKNGKKITVSYMLPMFFKNKHYREDFSDEDYNNLETSDEESVGVFLPENNQNNLKVGYYLITSPFFNKERVKTIQQELKEKGLNPKLFIDPDYELLLHFGPYNSLKEARKLKISNMNGLYLSPLSILKVDKTSVKESDSKKEASNYQKERISTRMISENQNLKAGYYLETGGFSNQKDLDNEMERLKKLGVQPNFYETLYGYFITYLASYPTLEEAKRMKASGMNGMYNGNLNISKITIEPKKKAKSYDIKDEDLLSVHLSKLKDNKIELGYYLITHIFKRNEYLEKAMKKFNKIGIPLKYFKNPKDGYFYTYIERYDQLEEAKKMLFSNINDRYYGELFILKIY